ncbi:TPA: hypothetical protein ACGUPM_002650 [Vibrio vulnificus]
MSTVEQKLAAVVESAENLTQAVEGKVGEIDHRVEQAEAEFNSWLQLKDVIGEPDGQGTMRMNIFQGIIYGAGAPYSVSGAGGFIGKITDLGSSMDVFIHLKTPMNINTSDEMFWFNIRGYCYGASKIIDETIVGYCYAPQRNIINKASFGELLPESYYDSAGNVILRIKVPNCYFTTIRVDTMRVGTTTLFDINSLDAKVSLTETVEF